MILGKQLEESFRNAPENGSNFDFLELAARFPNINFVGAHSGGPFDFAQLWDLDCFGHDRVLFGTDWPWGRQEAPVKIVLEACGGDAALEDQVFFQNAEKLLGGEGGERK